MTKDLNTLGSVTWYCKGGLHWESLKILTIRDKEKGL